MRIYDTIGWRIASGFILVSLILAASTFTSLWKVSNNSRLITGVNEIRVPTVRASLTLLNGINQGVAAFRGLILYHDKTSLSSWNDAWQDTDTALDNLKRLGLKENGHQNVEIEGLENRMQQLHTLQGQFVGRLHGAHEIELVNEKVTPLVRDIRADVEHLVGVQESTLRGEVVETDRSTRSVIYLEWILLGSGLLAALSIGLLVTRSITSSMARAVGVSTRLAGEDFDFEVNLSGPREIEIFGASLEKMRQSLKTLTRGLREKNTLLEEQKWQIDGQVGLLEQMAGDLTVPDLAGKILDFLCQRVGALRGVFYALTGDLLVPVASFAAHGRNKELHRSFSLREGLVGQAAAESRPIVAHDLPPDYFKIASGLGESVPRDLMLLPVSLDGEATAVIEIAGLRPLENHERRFLEGVTKNVGISVNLSRSTQKTKELLEETQVQAEELQAQQEELRASNEELEAKTQSLEASERELVSQQEELKAINEELEEQTLLLEKEKETLARRTLELEQTKERLELRAREVEQVSRYKTEFLANMSHELRTPLNSILMLSQSLTENRGGNLLERQMNALKTIYSSGTDLLTLIEDILDLSKVEAGKLEVKPESVALADLFDGMKQSFEPMAREGHLEFLLDLQAGLPAEFVTDSTRIKQVLKNLLSNAFKFTDHGSVTLRAYRPASGEKFKLVQRKAPCLCFAIVDTGIGIPKQQIDAVFEAFKQLDAKTTRKYSGTGLGLSIVRELVGLLGGEIRLESQEGQGTTVTVCIPEVLAKAIDKTPPTVEESTKKPKVLSRKSVRELGPSDDDRQALSDGDSVILIVEDDPDFAASLLEACRENGFKGVVLSDGISAVKAAEEFLPQGILLDLSLPELDGNDVLRLLKENPKTRPIPVQVITGHDSKNEVLSAGAIGFLRKPVQREQLTGVLNRIRDSVAKEKKLLIIEDDSSQRRAILEFIDIEGVITLEAESGTKGLEILAREPVDCIVLDLNLPDMEGRQFIQKARSLGLEVVPPIIVYTGRDLNDAELKALESESNSIIMKGSKSPERLFDEATMFLHRLQKDLPIEKRKIIESLHDPTRVLKGKSVLVVDDDPRNVLSLRHLLEDHGVEVFECDNGKAALSWLDQGRAVDLILMDMMMPEMDGYEATRQIRKNPRFSGVPVVALTARAMRGERERCLEAGCDDYLSKPIENDRLISLLRVWLYRRS